MLVQGFFVFFLQRHWGFVPFGGEDTLIWNHYCKVDPIGAGVQFSVLG